MSIPPEAEERTPGLRIELGERVWVPHGACRWRCSRAGGPGGQHVNTTDSKVTLHLAVDALVGLNRAAKARLRTLLGDRLTQDDELVLSSERERSQVRNRALVLRRLRALIEQALVVPTRRIPTRPGRAAKQRRLNRKKQTGQKKARRRERFE
jgi:ribosome-associated protein